MDISVGVDPEESHLNHSSNMYGFDREAAWYLEHIIFCLSFFWRIVYVWLKVLQICTVSVKFGVNILTNMVYTYNMNIEYDKELSFLKYWSNLFLILRQEQRSLSRSHFNHKYALERKLFHMIKLKVIYANRTIDIYYQKKSKV